RGALEVSPHPAPVRPELREGLSAPLERLAPVELLSVTIPGMHWDQVTEGPAAVLLGSASFCASFCAGEMCRQELSGPVQCRGRFVEDRVVGLEDVGYTGGDVEGDLDVGDGGLPREAFGIVDYELVGF